MADSLHIRLLGPFRVERDGAAVALPQSRKARALLALLATTGREHRRQQLCEWLWPDVDDPRGALRGALSRLRGVVDDADRPRLRADGDGVQLDLSDVAVDARALSIDLPTPQLIAAVESCRGEFLEDLELPDALAFRAFCAAERERLGRARRAALDELVKRLASTPEAALPFARARAELQPRDPAAQARLLELLNATGRSGEAAERLELERQWRKQRGEPLPAVLVPTPGASSVPPEPPAPAPAPNAAKQQIHFCATPDGTRVAYAISGSGPLLFKTANWLNHLEHDWQNPIWGHWLQTLSSEYRLVRYDERGNGLSDRDVGALSLDVFVDDLESVARAAKLERYPLFAVSQGCPVAIAHAVRHPERVSHLVLFNGFARGWRASGSRRAIETMEALITLMKHGWGRNQPAFRQVFTSMFFPLAPAAHMHAFNETQRSSATPEQAIRLLDAIGDLDVSALLSQVKTPTLVLSCRHDGLVPYEEGRRLASSIPNARFVTLESHNHVLLPDEPAFAQFFQELRAFLATSPESVR